MKKLDLDSAVVLHSGGQDSTTCLYWALSKYRHVETLSFDYGQRHRAELEAARRISDHAKVKHSIVSLSGLSELGGSSLTDSQVPVTKEISQSDGLPVTFVPGRNIIFLSYAAAFAYQRNIGVLVTGVCETDYSGYPDCRAATMEEMTKTLQCGLEANFSIETPLMFLSKADTVRLAQELDALEALSLTHTCYNGAFPPCGQCDACELRAKGFSEAGVQDPLLSVS